jgi:hypothetical protein
MKTTFKLFIIGLASSFSVGALTARANLEVSASASVHATADFYAPLATSGTWIEAGAYGRCWRPGSVAPAWRPYCSGHWVWTDCGWYWASEEPWAWACYHYGCWVDDPAYGWVWAPGIEWAPAWVTWRIGSGYIGWAPVPPRGVTMPGSLFTFVKTARFQSPIRPSMVIVNNSALINNSIALNNIRRQHRSVGGAGTQEVVINQGPNLGQIEKASGRTIKAIAIGEAARQARVPVGLSHSPGELKTKSKPAVPPGEQPQSAPERAAPPGAHWAPPVEGHVSSPHATPTPVKPPESSPGHSAEQSERTGHEPEGGHPGRN